MPCRAVRPARAASKATRLRAGTCSRPITVISEAAVFEAVKHRRALGDISPVTTEDLWGRVAEDMSRKDYKPLGMDLATAARRSHEKVVDEFHRFEHHAQVLKDLGRHPGAEVRARTRETAVARTLATQIVALDVAIARNGVAVSELGQRGPDVLGQDARADGGDRPARRRGGAGASPPPGRGGATELQPVAVLILAERRARPTPSDTNTDAQSRSKEELTQAKSSPALSLRKNAASPVRRFPPEGCTV